MNKDDEQKYLEEFNGYFPPWNRDAGVINWIQEDLERIKNMTDENLEEKVKETERLLKINEKNRGNIVDCWCKGMLWHYKDISEYDTVNKYKRLVDELRDLYYELRKKENTEMSRMNTKREREREREQFITKQS